MVSIKERTRYRDGILVNNDLAPEVLYPLPFKIPAEDRNKKGIIPFQAAINGLIKNRVGMSDIKFQNKMYKLLNELWHKGYDRGLSDMDKMHKSLEP